MTAIWTPQPKQALWMSRPEDEALYGGAAGGGKSDAMVAEAARQIDKPAYRGLILRRTYPQLEDLIEKSRRLYPKISPGASYNSSNHTWRFKSGASIRFGSLPHKDSIYDYQGRPFDFIGFDELTQFDLSMYEYLLSRNRPNAPGMRCYCRATANPGGVGHGWVKQRFVTAGPPMQTIWQTVDIVQPDGKIIKNWISKIYVPSTVFDNTALLKNDPNYLNRLASLPEAERKALLYGDWDTFSGQVFIEFRDRPDHYNDRVQTHVIAPFSIPKTWRIYCGMDWGYTHPFSLGWWAVDGDCRMYRIREWYGCTGTPNVGIKMRPDDVAEGVLKIEKTDPNLKNRRIIHIGDPAIWGSDGLESIGEVFQRHKLYFEPADHDRLSGKMQIHNRLAFDSDGIPMMYVFSTCKDFIRTMPALPYSQTKVEDIDTEAEDHIYDETRYVCMAHPYSPPEKEANVEKPYNPLDHIDVIGETKRRYDGLIYV